MRAQSSRGDWLCWDGDAQPARLAGSCHHKSSRCRSLDVLCVVVGEALENEQGKDDLEAVVEREDGAEDAHGVVEEAVELVAGHGPGFSGGSGRRGIGYQWVMCCS